MSNSNASNRTKSKITEKWTISFHEIIFELLRSDNISRLLDNS